MSDLKDANTNPWYLMMTLYGEQTGEDIDWALHEKNKRAWNAWACQNLSDAEREALREAGAYVPGPEAWGEMEAEIRAQFAERAEGTGVDDLPSADSSIDLQQIRFSNTVVLENLIFTQAVFFDSATFEQAAFFNSAGFEQAVFFDSATFEQAADFSFVNFMQFADFSFVNFMQFAGFNSATFMQAADFSSATFEQTAFFDSATFGQRADFHFAVFEQTADFQSAMFTQGAYFGSAGFAGFAYFFEARFGNNDHPISSGVSFVDCQFEKPTSFREVVFADEYPDFSGAMLHPRTQFTADPAFWPADPKQDAAEVKSSCAAIRHAVAGQGLIEEEQFFHRREMQFAGRVGSWWQRFPYRFYGWVSDYGHSIARPAFWLVALWVVPALIYTVAFVAEIMAEDGWHPLFGFGFSFANIFKFFGFQRTYFSTQFIQDLHWTLQAFSAFQTVAGFALLFFLGLGLRSRFRLR